MIALDMKTVMITNVLLNIVCLIELLRLWQLNHNKYKGLQFWALDFAMLVSGTILIALRGVIPDWASMVLSNSLIVGGTLVLYYGLVLFTGKKSPVWLNFIIPAYMAAFILVHLYFTYVNNELLARNFNISIGLALASCLSIWLLFRGASREIRSIAMVPGIAFIIILVICLARIMGFITFPPTSNDYFKDGLFDTSMVMLYNVAIIFLAISLILMVNRRLSLETRQAGQALRENEAKYRTLFETMLQGVVYHDAAGYIISTNPAAERILGLTRNHMLGKISFNQELKAIHEDGSPYSEDNHPAMVALRTGKEVRNARLGVLHPAAHEYTWLDINAVPQYKQGEALPYQVYTTFEDITELKKTEHEIKVLLEEAKTTAREWQSTFDAVTDIVTLISPEHKFLRVNAAGCRAAGKTEKELIGKKCYEVIHGLTAPICGCPCVETLSTGMPGRGEIYENGRHYILTSSPVLDGDGKMVALAHTFHDFTKRKKAEQELQESKRLVESIIENIPLMIFLKEATDLRFVLFNRAGEELLGYDRQALLGKNNLDLFPPEQAANFMAKDRAVLDSKAGILDIPEETILTARKGQRLLHTQKICIRGADGVTKYLLGISEDITERKLSEAKTIEIEALQRTNQAKSALLANVSHELRTPLAIIKGFIETLIEPDVEWSKEQQLDFLKSANIETDHLTVLIKELLDMSIIDSGKMVLDKSLYSVKEILDSAEFFLSTITAKHKLKKTILPDLPPLQADKVRIGQVIINLVENAVKFSPEGSQIEIEALLKGSSVVFSVQDHGIGMPPEVISNLFNRFYQARQVVEGKSKGTGLGLAISKGVVEAHGGKIWVESQPVQGSKFSFSLPVNQQLA